MSIFDKDLAERKLYIEVCADLIHPFAGELAASGINEFNNSVDHVLRYREGHGFDLNRVDFQLYTDSIKRILIPKFDSNLLYITDIYQIVDVTTPHIKIAINYYYYPAQPPEVVRKYLEMTKSLSEGLYNEYIAESKNFQSEMKTLVGFKLIPVDDHIIVTIDPVLLTVK